MKGQFILLLFLASFVKIAQHSTVSSRNYSSALLFLRSLRKAYKSSPTQTSHQYPFRTFILLLLSGDIQSNPGPRTPKYPCGVCSKAVKWDPKSPSVCCDSCNVWYHQKCMAMPDSVFSSLKNISWECCQCGLPNFSTSLFNTTIMDSTNSFEALSSPFSDASDMSFSCPGATSSPKGGDNGQANRSRGSSHHGQQPHRKDIPMRILVVNCQSVREKKPLLETLVDSTEADVIIGTESWLNSDINSNEVFPQGFTAYRRDRASDSHGGVFVLVSSRFESCEPEELQVDSHSQSELLWVKV